MIAEVKRGLAHFGVSAVIVGVWLSGLAGWLGTVAAAPFAIGLIFRVWRQE